MNKNLLISLSILIVCSGCGTYAGSGAYAGSSLGSILGSAIGGISGGPRGSDLGTIIGMAGGAVVGGAIGANADKKREADLDQYQRDKEIRAQKRAQRQKIKQQKQENMYDYQREGWDASGYDETNSGDDRLLDFERQGNEDSLMIQYPTKKTPATSSVERLAKGLTYAPTMEIRNARLIDQNQDGAISRGEVCKVVFEVYNQGTQTLYNVEPIVLETTNNKHITISPSVRVEQIEPGTGIRYTAMVKADNRLKSGRAKICATVVQRGRTISKVCEFDVITKK